MKGSKNQKRLRTTVLRIEKNVRPEWGTKSELDPVVRVWRGRWSFSQFHPHLTSRFCADFLLPNIFKPYTCEHIKAMQNTSVWKSCLQNVGEIDTSNHPNSFRFAISPLNRPTVWRLVYFSLDLSTSMEVGSKIRYWLGSPPFRK